MPTFKFNSERPYYQNGRLVKKVNTQQTISLSAMDCTVIGWNVARLLGLLGRLTLALIFKRNPYRLS